MSDSGAQPPPAVPRLAVPRLAVPRLVVPEGLVIDETVRERLERQLALAPEPVAGIAAEVAELAPGESYRVHVEWAGLEAPVGSESLGAHAASSRPVRGAVLLRPHAEFSVRDGSVVVTGGSVLADPGAPVHDPSRTIGPLQPASERGRPPFPRRPVVVFLGCTDEADADWVRRLVNRLVRHDVEARIAMPVVAPGVHLTRPCLPGEMTIRTLAPDVVVTLDGAAAEQVDAWCTGDRSTVVVAFDPALPDPMELVSWQIGHAAGRLRARIGPWVDVVAFASLVGRLCAGPHPVPPSDESLLVGSRRPVRERWTGREAGARPAAEESGCVIVTGTLDAPAAQRVSGFADNLEAAGIPVSVTREMGAGARHAAIVLLAGVAPGADLDSLVADRRAAGRPMVVDAGRADLELDPGSGAVRLGAPAVALIEACGCAVSPAGVVADLAAAAARRSLVLPTLLTRSRAAALRDARTSPDPGAALVIGWRLTKDDARPEYVDAVAAGIATTLEDRRNRVEIVGDAAGVPAALREHERVTVVAGGTLDPEMLARWAVHVWTPAVIGGEVVDDARVFAEAGCAGVPTVLPACARRAVDGYISPFVLVDNVERADQWANSLHHVLDNDAVRDARAGEARRRADALDSPDPSKAVITRFAGWARFHSHDDLVRT